MSVSSARGREWSSWLMGASNGLVKRGLGLVAFLKVGA
jgi:hypothetical protein